MTAVSVLMPCRDAADTLDEALSSLWSQSFENFEVIAVDDGSTDETLSLLREAAVREPRLMVLARDHRGIAATLELARAEASGSLIARMDADDVAHPDRFALQVEHFERIETLRVSCSKVRLFPRELIQDGYLRYESWVNSVLSHDDIRRNVFIESPVPHPSVMMRRDALEAVGGYRNVGWPEDYDLWMRLLFSGGRFEKLSEVLVDWRDGPKRASRVQPAYAIERFLDVKEHYLRAHVLPPERPLAVWGAGPVGKGWAARLKPAHIIELDPRKLGQRIHGAEVISNDELQRLDRAFIVVAVGALSRKRGPARPWLSARDEIREQLEADGFTELVDYVCVA